MRSSAEQQEVRVKGGAGNAHPSPAHLLPRNWNLLDTGLLCRGTYPPVLRLASWPSREVCYLAVVRTGTQIWGCKDHTQLPTSEGSGTWGLAALVRGAWGAPTLPRSCALATAHLWLPRMEVTDTVVVRPILSSMCPKHPCLTVPTLEAWRPGRGVAR